MEGTGGVVVVQKAGPRLCGGPSCLGFDLPAYRGGRMTDVEPLRGKAGWARVAKLHIKTPAVTREHLVIAAVADSGDPIHPEIFERLFRVPAQNEPPFGAPPESDLQSRETVRRKELLDEAEQQNAEWLDV